MVCQIHGCLSPIVLYDDDDDNDDINGSVNENASIPSSMHLHGFNEDNGVEDDTTKGRNSNNNISVPKLKH